MSNFTRKANILVSCIFSFLASLITSAGYSQTVFLGSDGQVVVEAETFSSRTFSDTHAWLIVPEESAGSPSEFLNYRGSGYVQASPEGTGASAPLDPPFIDYKVRISTVGEYRLYVRWVGPNDRADTFYVSIAELSDGSGGSIADWYRYIKISGSPDFSTSPTWFGSGGFERTNSPYSNGETPVVWNISTPGDYTLRFDMREDGAAIDAFVFQLSSLPAPTGDGPPPSDVVQGNPQINLSTNQTNFVPGDFLILNLDMQQGTQNNQIDGWVGVVLPDGSFAFLQSDLTTFSSTAVPTVQNFMATDFSGPLFQLQIPSVLPAGTYSFLAVGVVPGTDPFETFNHITNVASAAITLTVPAFVPDISGVYTGSGTTSWDNCLDPTFNVTYNFSATLNISSQTGSTFNGSATSEFNVLGFNGSSTAKHTGMVTTDGQLSGTFQEEFFFGGMPDSKSTGTFAGQATENTMSIQFAGHDVSGDTCTFVGTMSLNKSP